VSHIIFSQINFVIAIFKNQTVLMLKSRS
jgi:hypothetical protein